MKARFLIIYLVVEYMYKLKKSYMIVQLLLVCFGLALTIIIWLNVFSSNIFVINTEITSHITNFSLSLLAIFKGSFWLTSGEIRFVVVWL